MADFNAKYLIPNLCVRQRNDASLILCWLSCVLQARILMRFVHVKLGLHIHLHPPPPPLLKAFLSGVSLIVSVFVLQMT